MSTVQTNDERDPFEHYLVVRNAKGDHSIWPSVKTLPAGWDPLDMKGSRAECLSWIEQNWSGPQLG
ncbi:MbtH family NRPS accessory protein [Parachitinimonas caeni]|uniref:MbtH family NRPS accessory protein n=1 Tax=Parachitinimonas caeni TaxID=3031301 RepID=A0ABT7E254_9NEIS|nr:MbtH family NRPS accessory protein [Parachitinimonas caeni]MDK2125423.1 MbtH family NRPS accessory protein [Parachitinimonas caeni]